MNQIFQLADSIMEKQNLSFIGSVDNSGFPAIQAMLRPRKREGMHTVYFSTNAPTHKVMHFMKNPKACVYFFDPNLFQGILLQGTMEVLEDAAHKEMLWQPGDELYYPGGVSDPEYVVLRFTAKSGRCYQNFSSTDFSID